MVITEFGMDKNIKFRLNAHAVIIGIDKYQDQKIPNLNFARADAEGIYQILTDSELGRISSDNVILLLDDEATQRNIRSAIGTKLPRRVGENDTVYIYYAGHGAPAMDPKSRSRDGMEKYIVPADADLDDLRATGISMDEIQKFFGWIESKQVMFFIDSCYSGEAGGRTFQHPLYQGRHLLSAEFLEDLASEGRLVMTACDVNEVSLETPDIGHGLFSHYLIEGLKGTADKDQDGLVTSHELYDYVYEKVSQHARKMGGSMHPIQKGSIRGKIFLTQYETETQRQVKALHVQAQSYHARRKFDKAYDLWQSVIKLMPDHKGAKRGIADIDNRREEEKRKRQEILEHRQEILLNFYHEGELQSDEFELAMALIEKEENELTAKENKIKRLLDDFADGKISVSSYLKSVRLLRKPVVPEEKKAILKSEFETERKTPITQKIKLKRIPITEIEHEENEKAVSRHPAEHTTVIQSQALRTSPQLFREPDRFEVTSLRNAVASLTEAVRLSKTIFLKWLFFSIMGAILGLVVSVPLVVVLLGKLGLRYILFGEVVTLTTVLLTACGAIVGIMQWLILRQQLSLAGWWTLISTLGWGVGGGLIGTSFVKSLNNVGGIEEAVMVAIIGSTVAGIMQWVLLRRQFSRAGWWIMTSILPWPLAGIVVSLFMDIVSNLFISLVVGGVFGSIVWSILTGVAFVWLLRHPVSEH